MKSLLRWLFPLVFFISAVAQANWTPYSQSAFDKLQAEGKPTLVLVHADWCPTCRAQAPIISSLLSQKEYQGITALRVDFDTQKDVVRAFHVPMQSTLIVFTGGKEVGRSTGDTTQTHIEALLQKTLKSSP
jgi:thioredoxin-like negative regulator of GroEL